MVKDSVKVKYDKYLKMEEVLYQTIILSSPEMLDARHSLTSSWAQFKIVHSIHHCATCELPNKPGEYCASYEW
jgi:hypothetical protein